MFSYYMPKVRWDKGKKNGHRHYWASVVVWINRWGCSISDSTGAFPVGVSFTTDHANWGVSPAGVTSYRSGVVGLEQPTHPKMQIHNNVMGPFKGADGDWLRERTLVGWESLTDKVKKSLNDVRYEKTLVPFSDNNFQTFLDASYKSNFYGALMDQQGCPEASGQI